MIECTEDKDNVFALVRPTSDICKLRQLLNIENILIVNKSLFEIESIISSVRPTTIFHLATWSKYSCEGADIEQLVETNLLFGLHLLSCASKLGTESFIHAGTSWQTYESNTYNPLNLYAASKEAFENLAKYYATSQSIKFASLRLFDTYGSDDNRKKIINILLNSIKKETPLDLSPGYQKLSPVYIQDVSRAFILAANHLSKSNSEQFNIWNVRSHEAYTLREIHKILENVSGKALPVKWGGRDYRSREVMQLKQTYENVPGWKEEVSLAEGLKMLLME